MKKKSFYELVFNEVGRIKVTVIGNDEILHDEEKEPKYYKNWSEVENILGAEILRPSYLPQGYVLGEITIDNTFLLDKGWNLLEEENNIQYYQKENQIEAFFIYEKGVYIIRGEIDLEEMKKVANSMFN